MSQGHPWQVRGIDPDLRDAAILAANRSGMTLGQWLNQILAESAAPDHAPRDDYEEPPRPRRAKLRERPSGAALSARARADAADESIDRVNDIVENAIARIERASRETQTRTAGLIERVAAASESAARPAAARHLAPGLESLQPRAPAPETSTILSDSLKAIAIRLDGLDRRFAGRGPQETAESAPPAAEPPPLARPVLPETLESAGHRGDRVARLEAKIGAILQSLNRQRSGEAALPAPRSYGGSELNSALDEIAARQSALDGRPVQPRRAPPADQPASAASLKAEIAGLSAGIEAALRQRDESGALPLSKELAKLQSAIDGLAPRQSVQNIEAAVLDLARKVDSARSGGARSFQLEPLERLIGDLHSTMRSMRDPAILAGIRSDLGDLGRRLDTISAQPAQQDQARGLRDEIAAIRGMIGASHQSSALDGLYNEIGQLNVKLDRLAERPADVSAAMSLSNAVKDVRQALDRAQPHDLLAKVEERLKGLSDFERRMGALASKLERAASSSDQAALDEIRVRLSALQDGLQPQEPLQTPGFERALGDISAKIDRLNQQQHDPAITEIRRKLDQVYEAVSRSGAAAPAASPELLHSLQAISARLERLPSAASPLSSHDPRLDALLHAHQLDQTPERLQAIEDSFRALTDRLGSFQGVAPDARALAGIQDKISRLTDRIETADGSGRSLEAIETALRGLSQQVDAARRDAALAAESAARAAERSQLPAPSVDIGFIRDDLESLRTSQSASTGRMESTLGTMHGTLERLVERLAQAEVAAARQPLTVPPPAAAAAPARAFEPPRPVPAQPAAIRSAAAPAAAVSAEIEGLIEPGAGRAGAAAARSALPLEADSGSSKANFIAAARRAAQAAAQNAQPDTSPKVKLQAAAGKAAASKLQAVQSFYTARKKPILLSLAAVFTGLIAIQAAGSFLRGRPAQTPAPVEDIKKPAAPETVPQAAAPEPAPPAAERRSSIENRVSPQPAIAAKRNVDPLPTGSIGQEQPKPAEQAAASPQPVPETPAKPLIPALPVSPAPQAIAPAPAAPRGPLSAEAQQLIKQAKGERLLAAALQSDAAALHEIGARYADGRTLQRDPNAAAKLFEPAAAQGHAPSQYRLAALHREARVAAPDKKRAYDLFREAADAGHMRAMHNLGVMLAEGALAAPDYAAAAEWFGRAAEHNVRDSQYNLGILYARGLGVTQDLASSYRWFHAAAEQGDEDAKKKRDEVGSRIPAEKLIEVKAAAQRWRPSLPDPKINESQSPQGGWEAQAKPAVPKPRTAGRT